MQYLLRAWDICMDLKLWQRVLRIPGPCGVGGEFQVQPCLAPHSTWHGKVQSNKLIVLSVPTLVWPEGKVGEVKKYET